MISRAMLIFIFAAGGLAACTQANETGPEMENRVTIIEPQLVQAGFKQVPLDTQEKQQSIAALTPLRFNTLGRHGKIYYYFPDPQFCKCVYIGSELAYESYKQIHVQDKEVEQSSVDAQWNSEVPAPSPWTPVGSLMFP